MSNPTSIKKQAGPIIFLVEELSDARMRCEQLKQYVQEAMTLIEKSSHKDHFFEIAGHLLQGIPQTLFKLDKALGATALAASKMDYDELSNNLKPEKVDELEKALEDSRIHYVQRRSGETAMLDSNEVSTALRAIAKEAHATGKFPIRIASDLIAQLEGDAPLFPIEHLPNTVPTAVLSSLADAIDDGTIDSCKRIAKHLEHVVLSTVGGQEMVGLLQNAGSREDVMDGFKKENPALTKEQLEEIADQWEKNKDGFKTAAADFKKGDKVKVVKGPKGSGVGCEGVVVSDSAGPHGDQVSVALDHPVQRMMGPAIINPKNLKKLAFTNEEKLSNSTEKTASGFDRAKEQLLISLKNLDEYRETAILGTHMKIDALDRALYTFMRGLDQPQVEILKQQKLLSQAVQRVELAFYDVAVPVGQIQVELYKDFGFRFASDNEEKLSKFEEGVPADPTENMTQEDAKKWKTQTEEHKDEFKVARAIPKGDFALVQSHGMDDVVLSVHKTQEDAEKAMRKHGGEPNSMFQKGMRIVDVGPHGKSEIIEISGKLTTRPKTASA